MKSFRENVDLNERGPENYIFGSPTPLEVGRKYNGFLESNRDIKIPYVVIKESDAASYIKQRRDENKITKGEIDETVRYCNYFYEIHID